MKRIFTCLGVLVAIVVVFLVIVFAIFIPRAFQLTRDATTYIESEVPKIVQNWNPQELIGRAAPELTSTIKSKGDIDRLFEMFRQLGSLKQLDTPTGGVHIWMSTYKGSSAVGNFTAHAEFDNGPATIIIQLLRMDDTWKINGFEIRLLC
jgi:hypothetical protein